MSFSFTMSSAKRLFLIYINNFIYRAVDKIFKIDVNSK